MAVLLLLKVVAAFGLIVERGNCDGYFKVLGPKVLRPNSEFHVAVSVQETSQPTTITVSVEGTTDATGKAYQTRDAITVLPYSTRIARLEIGDLERGVYKLVVQGTGGLTFQTARTLTMIPKSYSILVQTDRPVYAPGQTILFRTLVLNSQLRPAAEIRNEPIDVQITDGSGNKVKQWKNVFVPNGVFTGELKLAGNPVLGRWNISVALHKQMYHKSFDVAQYMLPKFYIDITAQKHITFQENILTANINARYHYGKPVQGDCTVSIYPTIHSGVIQPIFQQPIRKVVPLTSDGTVTVNFDISKELRLSDEFSRTVVIDVRVEEALTGRLQNNSATVQVHKYDYKMEIIKSADYYKPGMVYTTWIKVSNYDGSSIENNRRTVVVRHGYSRIDEVYAEEKHILDKSGVIKLELYPPMNYTNDTALRIEAEYIDLKERLPPVPAAVSFSNTYMQVSLLTDRPIVNLDVEVFVNCTEPMQYVTYELLGRGDVIVANTFKVDNKKEFRFHFTATHAMAPVAHLLVSYTRSNGELVADSLDIYVDGLLQNFIEIQTNTLETSAESDIDLTVRAQPNSYIGLMAVDGKMAAALNDPDMKHDLARQMIANELATGYDESAEKTPYEAPTGSKSLYFWKVGSSNINDIFENSGGLLITNSIVTNKRPTLEDIYVRPVSYGSSTVKPDRGAGLNLYTVTRPPLAGPYAFSRIPRPVWDKPKVYLNRPIYDTWLFMNFSSGFDGKTSIRRRVPAWGHNWYLSGFSLHPLHGLGLLAMPKLLKVSNRFHVAVEIPRHVQRGETVAAQVAIFNHLNKEITAEVTLHNNEQEFRFAEVSNEVNGTIQRIELYRKKRVNVKANSGTAVTFMITPQSIGNVAVKATANTQNSQGSDLKVLRVLSEGEQLYFSKTMLLDLRKSSSLKSNVTVDIPKNVVPGSEHISVSVAGDLFAPVLKNLVERGGLSRKPAGTAEANLARFYPSLVVLQYLRSTGQPNPTIERQAMAELEVRYQEHLSYRLGNRGGSFSAFGKTDDVGSIWMTAYTATVFAQARPFIYIDEDIVSEAFRWLADHQAPNGSFVESAAVRIQHRPLQSRDENSLALTAFVVLAFLDNKQYSSIYSNTIKKSLDYIARYIDEGDDVYSIAICSYALHVARHPSKQNAFNLLDSKAKTNKTQKWWGVDIPKADLQNPWNYQPRSIDIETTSYGLLALLETNLLDDAVPIYDWLTSQMNDRGGFASTQASRVALHALYKMALKVLSAPSIQAEFAYRPQETNRLGVNAQSAMIVQQMPISNTARLINVTAEGRGVGYFQVSYDYSMNVTGPWPLFTLDPQVDKNSDAYHLQLSICTAFVSRTETASNLAVMEVNLPSGYTVDVDSLPSLEVSQNVQKVETTRGNTAVVLYFNNITRTEFCPTVSAFRTHKVARQKPVPVIVYDFYDSSRRARVFYRPQTVTTLCDICEDEDCSNICVAELSRQRQEEAKAAESRKSNSQSSVGEAVLPPAGWMVFTAFSLYVTY